MAEFNPEERLVAGPQFDKIYCPSCNSPNPDGVTFCVHCAAYLGDLEDSPSGDTSGEDALDTLLARQKEAASASPDDAVPVGPPASAPPPLSTPTSAPSADSEDADSDELSQAVQLADGRIVTKASTLAKLEKLQKILGDSGPLTGAKAQNNEVVAYLEKKVAEQAAALEKLREEKEAIIQEYMADALGAEEKSDATVKLEAASREVARLTAELARASGAEAGLHAELANLRRQSETHAGEVEELRGQLFGAASGGGDGEGAPLALAEAQRTIRDLETKLSEAEDHIQATDTKLAEATERTRTVDAKLAEAAERVRSSDAKLTEAAERVRASDAKLTEAAERVRASDAKLTEAADRIRASDAKLTEAAERIRTYDAKLAEAAARLQKAETTSPPPGLEAAHAKALARLAELEAAAPNPDELTQAKAALAVTRTALEAEQEASADLRQQLAAATSAPAGADPDEVARLTAQIERLGAGAKEQVRTVTRYYERILSRTTCGVLVLASNGAILSINAAGATMLGVPAPDLLRRSYEELPVLTEVGPLIRMVLAEGKDTGPLPRALDRGDGAPLAVRVTAARGELGTREVCVLVLDDSPLPSEPSDPPPARSSLASIQEDLFGIRMMVELLTSKAENPGVVRDVAGGLLEDLDRTLEKLKGPSSSG